MARKSSPNLSWEQRLHEVQSRSPIWPVTTTQEEKLNSPDIVNWQLLPSGTPYDPNSVQENIIEFWSWDCISVAQPKIS
jgi:hypothetical protein